MKTYIFILLFLIVNFSLFATPKTENKINVSEGKVEIFVTNKGTFSEVKYFLLVNNREKIVIFNEKGLSIGFDDYINKKVVIEYEIFTGKIGWKGEKKEGYKIISIEVIK